MNTPERSTVVGVAVVVVIAACGVLAAWKVFVCRPPADQAHMVELWQADPLFAVVPSDGQLVDGYAHTGLGRTTPPIGEDTSVSLGVAVSRAAVTSTSRGIIPLTHVGARNAQRDQQHQQKDEQAATQIKQRHRKAE